MSKTQNLDNVIAEECTNNLIPRFQPRKDPLGCYAFNESSSIDTLDGLSTLKFSDPYRDRDKNLMDPGLCVTHCANYLFKFAALGNGTDCRCGYDNGLTAYIPVDKENCNIDCVGNISIADKTKYKCGGNKTYTVYDADAELPRNKETKISISKKLDIINHLDDDAYYRGCIKDSVYCDQRALDGASVERSDMTINTCMEFCNQGNFNYSGLETGTQCFCAKEYNSINMLSPEECSSSCSGDSSQICGGPLTLSIYEVRKIPTSPPHSSSNSLKVGLATGNSSVVHLLAIIFCLYYWFVRK